MQKQDFYSNLFYLYCNTVSPKAQILMMVMVCYCFYTYCCYKNVYNSRLKKMLIVIW